MLNNENKPICAACQMCCKNMGCHLSPSKDINGDVTVNVIVSLLSSGKFIVDWWEGDIMERERSESYYIRCKNKNESGYRNGSWGGECVNFTEGLGCQFTWDERPLGGKALYPKTSLDGTCVTKYSKSDSAKEWYPYNDIILSALKIVEQEED
jgi:hypothetical protein